jgi:hypothetical protein
VELRTARRHDDEPNDPEVSAIGDSARSFDSPEDLTEYFNERATTLLEEMAVYGYSGVIIAAGYDPLEKNAPRIVARRGNYYTVIGLLDDAKFELQHQSLGV